MRRRRRRYTWFPTIGNFWQNGAEVTTHVTSQFIDLGRVGTNRFDASPTETVPIVPDFTVGPDGTLAHTLRDAVEGQDWLLKRIVGKCHVCVWTDSPQVSNTVWPWVQVTCGFFVARASDESPAIIDLTIDEADPMLQQNVQNPWIWRNQWILKNPIATPAYSLGLATVVQQPPYNNWSGYGSSAKDGPHIDIKVARRIVREHRLWFVAAARGWSPEGVVDKPVSPPALQPRATVEIDLRVLGALRRGKNTSSF